MKKLSSISLALLSMLSFSALADTANLEDLEKACNASDGTACESIAKAYELGFNAISCGITRSFTSRLIQNF